MVDFSSYLACVWYQSVRSQVTILVEYLPVPSRGTMTRPATMVGALPLVFGTTFQIPNAGKFFDKILPVSTGDTTANKDPEIVSCWAERFR